MALSRTASAFYRLSARRAMRFAHGPRSFSAGATFSKPTSSQDCLELERTYGAENYHPIPVVLARGKGVHMWDMEGKQYLDCLSAFSAVNQGHCHPRIVKALQQQAETLTLTSRAFYNDKLGVLERDMCERFGYERVLLMNSGVEACESAVKFARRWGYDVRGVPDNQGTILFPENNFWGRSISAVSSSTDPESRKGFGPFTPGFGTVKYGDLADLERALDADPNVIAFMVEPVQGEAGVVVPPDGYLRAAQDLLHSRGALMIADEVQTGLGRTGKWLASHHDRHGEDDDWKPDMLVLGKALSGGVFPVSAMLASAEVMLSVRPGQHGSTYGGNPLGAAVAIEALAVLEDEKLAENAAIMGERMRAQLSEMLGDGSQVLSVRGRGLLNAVVIRPGEEKDGGPTAWDVCLAMKDRGVLAKPTHGDIIRLAPPLTVTETDVDRACEAIRGAVTDVFGEGAVP